MLKLNNAWSYCEQKVAVPGSDWYYALLKTPVDIKQASLALLALEADWHAITQESLEPAIAEIKLAWWQQALNDAEPPTHPALQLLQPVSATFAIQKKLLNAMFEAAVQINHYRFDDFNALQRAAFSKISALLLIGLFVLGKQQAQLATPVHQLVFSLQLFSYNQHIASFLQRGMVSFAEQDLQLYGLNLDTPELWPKEALASLMSLYHDRGQTLYEQALHTLSANEKTLLKPLLRYAKIQWKLAQRLKQAGFPAGWHHIQLSPIHKLFLTWFY
jgi:phytoene synthase